MADNNIVRWLNERSAAFDMALLVFLFMCAHGLRLLNNGIFWDDLCLYGMPDSLTLERFRQTGSVWGGYLHVLLSAGGVTAYRIVSFIAYLFSALCLFEIAKKCNIDRLSRFFLVLMFAVFPVNNARIAMISIPYAIYHALFFCGFLLTTVYLEKRNIYLRIVSLLLLFVSFRTNSLLIFYLVVILYIMYRERPEEKSVRRWALLAAKYTDYLLLPILFWFVKTTFMKPYGLYATYNKIDSVSLSAALSKTFRVFDTSFLAEIDRSAGISFFSGLFQKLAAVNLTLPFIVLAGAVLVSYLGRRMAGKIDREWITACYFSILGMVLFWLAAFPYVVVGKMPIHQEMDTRHQLLLPLGAALLLIYLIRLFIPNKMFCVSAYILLASIFISADNSSNISFQRDWYKQLSLIANFRAFPPVRDNTAFLFYDETRTLNANQRSYGFYEYAGLMKEAFGDETRFGDEMRPYLRHNRSIMGTYQKTLTPLYKLGEFVPKEPDTFIAIRQGTTDVSTAGILKLMVWERFDREKFDQTVSNVVQLVPLQVPNR